MDDSVSIGNTRRIGKLTQKTAQTQEILCSSRSVVFTVKPIINWALPNSLNAYNRHSDWHKLTVYATKMSIYFSVSL